MRASELKALAYHEAGHAVVSAYEGLRPSKATIVADGDVLGSVAGPSRRAKSGSDKERARFEKDVVVLLAGPIAEVRFSGTRRSKFAAKDHEQAVWRIQSFESDEKVQKAWLAYLEERAQAWIWRHWRCWNEIKLVAAALLERRSLNGREILELRLSAEDDEVMLRKWS